MQVFCGNFEYDASERSILEMFERFGQVRRIDMKTGERASIQSGEVKDYLPNQAQT